MQLSTLVIRADAAAAIGTGHVVRCLALGQLWRDRGGDVIFVMAQSTSAIGQCIRAEGMDLIHIPGERGSEQDAKHLVEIARKNNAGWIVVDGYEFNSRYQRAIKRAGRKLMFVDDTGKCGPYLADVVLNQNVTAGEEMYSDRESYTMLLLGTKHALLRREFASWSKWKRSFPNGAKRVLVTMGGSDTEALTLPVIAAFEKIPDFRLTIVAGGSNPRIAELQSATNKMGTQIQLLTDVRDMAGIMAQSDLAVICGGGTLWEALYMGCAIVTYSRPGIQEQINRELNALGAVFDLGLAETFDEVSLLGAVRDIASSSQQRQSMAQRGREVVDARGASRVLQALIDGLDGSLGARWDGGTR
jgi:UDP-2,4-diacetamido-2,4,6-trideoxy-beta-L-altropyranose hydrolase